MNREFSSGSRQAPDPLDQFLEKHNFYRKHTARDASCLFRVVSEQIYDTQMHHLEIRKRCVMYMRKHKELFQPHIKRDIDEYLDDMSKPKTYGTLIELQAVGYLFQRNVIIFEPRNLGNLYVSRPNFKSVIRVFHTPERHFDSVYTLEYIKDVAVCQSIVYEILYEDFFKIADVSYAVERMLHQSTFDIDHYEEYNEYGYSIRMHLLDGQSFKFDLPTDTNCILENYKLCHFHNKNFSADLQRQHGGCNDSTARELDKNSINKNVESALSHKYVSCVRQLLEEGITPFPYKVAKALDPSMYRNIEFDSWNEARKELKLQNWYNGDANFKVGAKCNVKLRKSENDLYTCHIQEISQDKGCCVVFIEQLGEKRVVSYDSLIPLPPEQFKPWTLPYRFQRNIQKCSSFRLMRHYNCRWKLSHHPSTTRLYCGTPLSSIKSDYESSITEQDENDLRNYYKLKKLTNLEHFRTQPFEYCTMPITVENRVGSFDKKKESTTDMTLPAITNTNSTCENEHICIQPATIEGNVENMPDGLSPFELENAEMNANVELNPTGLRCVYPIQSFADGVPSEELFDGDIGCYPQSAVVAIPNGGTLYYMYNHCNNIPAGIGNVYMQYPQSPMAVPPPLPQPIINASNALGPVQNCFYYPTVPYCPANAEALLYQPIQQNNSNNSTSCSQLQTRCTYTFNGKINYEAKKSVKANGIDLPDIATLRYFYNLGLDYYHIKQNHKKNSNSSLNVDEVAKLNSEVQNLKIEQRVVVQETNSIDNNNNNLTTVSTNPVDLTPSAGQDQKSTHPIISVKQTKYNTNNYQRRHMRERYTHSNQNQRNNGSDLNKNVYQHDAKNNFNTKFKNNSVINTNRTDSQNVQEMTTNVTNNAHLAFTGNGYEISQMTSNDHIPILNMNGSTNINSNYGSNECSYDISGKSNNCVQMPLPHCPPPYGFYQPPPPACGTGAAYVASPPGALTNLPAFGPAPSAVNSGYYPSPQPPHSDIAADNRGDVPPGMHYQYVGYPPPMPLYCANMGAGMTGANVTVPAPHLSTQGFWCLPPPPNTPTSHSQPTTIRNTTSKSVGNNIAGISYPPINVTTTEPPPSS